MMVHHDNHHRPFPPYAIGYGDVDADGPTGNNNRPKTSNIYDVFASSDYGSGAAASAVASVGAVGVRILQPFDISLTTISTFLTPHSNPQVEISLLFLAIISSCSNSFSFFPLKNYIFTNPF